MTANQINFFKAKEEAKHWDRMDSETKRHNVQSESIGWEQNAIQSWWNQMQNEHLIRQDAINREHYERQDSETARHNKLMELLDYNELYSYKIPGLSIEQQNADTKSKEADIKEDTLNFNKDTYYLEFPYRADAWNSSTALNYSTISLNKLKGKESEAKARYMDTKGGTDIVNAGANVFDKLFKAFSSVADVLID